MKITAMAWVLKRYKLPIIVITFISFLVGAIYSIYVVKPVFTAKTVIMITTTDENKVQKFDYMNILANRQLVKIYSEIIKSSAVLDRVAIELGESVSADQLRAAITVRQVGGTELMEISALSGDPQSAANIANKAVTVFNRRVKDAFNVDNIKILEAAVANESPVKPNHFLNIITAVLLGFCIAVAFCLTFVYIRQPVGMPGIMDGSVGLIAQIPRLDRMKNNWDKLLKNKIIKNNFLYIQTLLIKKVGTGKIILMTSAADGEGKTTISEGLALTLCQSGYKVTVINADLSRTTQKNSIVFNGETVREIITENGEASEVLQIAGCPELRIVDAANSVVYDYQFLSSPVFECLLKEATTQSDLILIDGPALRDHAEATLLATKVDGVLLMSRSRIPAEQFKRVLCSLEQVQADVLGVVLNNV